MPFDKLFKFSIALMIIVWLSRSPKQKYAQEQSLSSFLVRLEIKLYLDVWMTCLDTFFGIRPFWWNWHSFHSSTSDGIPKFSDDDSACSHISVCHKQGVPYTDDALDVYDLTYSTSSSSKIVKSAQTGTFSVVQIFSFSFINFCLCDGAMVFIICLWPASPLE